MAKYQLNLNQIPNQSFSFNAGDHSVDMSLRTTTVGLFASMTIDGVVAFSGHRCVNQMPLLLQNKLPGNLYFEDRYATDDPSYEEFNTRFVLIYDEDYVL